MQAAGPTECGHGLSERSEKPERLGGRALRGPGGGRLQQGLLMGTKGWPWGWTRPPSALRRDSTWAQEQLAIAPQTFAQLPVEFPH